MALEVGSAYVTILPSAKGFGAKLKSEVGGVLDGAGTQAGTKYGQELGDAAARATGRNNSKIAEAGKRTGASYGTALKASLGAATGLIGAAVGSALGVAALKGAEYASSLEESGNKMSVVFGDAAKSVQDFAAQGPKALGMTEVAAREAAATFGVFGKAAGLTGQELSDFGNNLTKLAPDLASFHDADPSEVVTAMGSALRGEAEPMRRFGVLMDSASLSAQAMKMGLIENTKQALTPGQKTLAAYNLILEQTKDAQGDFARTWDDSWANQRRTLAATTEQMLGSLGGELIPILSEGTKSLVKGELALTEWGTTGIRMAKDMAAAFGGLPTPIKVTGSALAAVVAFHGPLNRLGDTLGGSVKAGFSSATSTASAFREAVSYARLAAIDAGTQGAGAMGRFSAGMRTFTGTAKMSVVALNGLKAAGTGLLTMLGGPLGLALTAVSVGVGVWMNQSEKAKQKQEELKGMVQELTGTLNQNTGAWTDNASKLLLAKAAEDNVIGNLESMGYSTQVATRALVENGDARKMVTEQIQAKINALRTEGEVIDQTSGAVLQLNGREIDYYQNQLNNLNKYVGAGSAAAAQMKEQVRQNEALKLTSPSQTFSTSAQEAARLEQKIKDATGALTKMDDRFKEMSGNLSVHQALVNRENQLKSIKEAIEKGNEAQGRKVRVTNEEKNALLGLASADQTWYKAALDSGKAADDSANKFAKNAAAFHKSALEAGYSKEEARKLTEELYKVPSTKGTTVKLFNKDNTMRSLKEIKNSIGEIPKKTDVEIRLQAYEVIGLTKPGTQKPSIPKFLAKADGGVLPGFTPGRDVHTFYSPTAGFLRLSGGESIMRPEWTRAVGVDQVNRWNAEAARGTVSSTARGVAFAAGGVVGTPTQLFNAIAASANAAGAAMRRAMSGVTISPAVSASLQAITAGMSGVTTSSNIMGATTRRNFTNMVTDSVWTKQGLRASENQMVSDFRWLSNQYSVIQMGPIRNTFTRVVTDARWTGNQVEATWVRMKAGMKALNDYFYMIGGGIRNTANRMVDDMRSPVRTILNEVIRDKLVWSWNAIAGKVKMDKWSFPGYRVGGWTGPGGKFDPAGIVHADEFVIRKESTSKLRKRKGGLQWLNTLNQDPEAAMAMGMPGFARGGLAKPWPTYVAGVARKLFPGIGAIGGYGSRSGYSDHSTGNALDFMVPDSSPLGDAIAAWGIANQAALKLKYIIWKKRIIGSGRWGGWRPYTRYGNSPNRTLQHYDHPHFSFIHDTPGNPSALGVKLSAEEVAALLAAGGGFGPNPEAERLKGIIDPKFTAARGIIERVKGMTGDWGPMVSEVGKLLTDKSETYMKQKIDTVFPAGIGEGMDSAVSGPAGASVQRWRSTVIEALTRSGLPTSDAFVNAWLRQISSESGGDNNIVQQIRDRNGTGARAGVGLVQVIPGTFAQFRDPSLPNNRKDPLANLVAGMRYAKSRYGSRMLSVIGHGHGYADGGLVQPELFDTGGTLRPGLTLAMNDTGKNETIRTYEQEKKLQAALAEGNSPIIINGVDYNAIPEVAEALDFAITRRRNRARFGG